MSRALLVAIASWLAWAALRFLPGGVEAWASTVAPTLAATVGRAAQFGPLPWTPLLFAAVLVIAVVAVRRADSRWRALARLTAIALLVGSTFELTWGLHESRPPATERFRAAGLQRAGGDAWRAHAAGTASPEEMVALATYVRNVLQRDEPESTAAWQEREAVASLARSVGALLPGTSVPERVRVVPPWLLGPWNVAGVISPWTLEAHVDGGMVPWQRIAIAGHELAHLAGFADEGDAEFVGLVAGLRADHPQARYAAALRTVQWLRRHPTWQHARDLPPRAQAELDRAAARSAERYRSPMADVSTRAYDLYLRWRGQEAGIAGYAAAPQRLAWALQAGLLP